MNVKKAFSIVVKRERDLQALSQVKVAERGGLNLDYYRDLEHARKQPSITYLFKVAEGLGIEPYKLIQYTEEVLAQSQPDSE